MARNQRTQSRLCLTAVSSMHARLCRTLLFIVRIIHVQSTWHITTLGGGASRKVSLFAKCRYTRSLIIMYYCWMGLCSGHGHSVVIREFLLYPQSLLAKLTVHAYLKTSNSTSTQRTERTRQVIITFEHSGNVRLGLVEVCLWKLYFHCYQVLSGSASFSLCSADEFTKNETACSPQIEFT